MSMNAKRTECTSRISLDAFCPFVLTFIFTLSLLVRQPRVVPYYISNNMNASSHKSLVRNLKVAVFDTIIWTWFVRSWIVKGITQAHSHFLVVDFSDPIEHTAIDSIRMQDRSDTVNQEVTGRGRIDYT